jgi:hypothetical protein
MDRLDATADHPPRPPPQHHPSNGTEERHMRKTIATLAAVVAGVAAFGSTADPAAADVPNPIYSSSMPLMSGAGHPYPSGVTTWKQCQTPQSRGVLGQYGAWGYYIDGCTVKEHCNRYNRNGCLVRSYTSINLATYRGDRVTQNARLRTFNSDGYVFGWSDRSCAGSNTCSTGDYRYLSAGQAASIQCNGVREAMPIDNSASNTCRIEMTYR